MDDNQKIAIKTAEKENGYLIELKNIANSRSKVEISLRQSENIRIRGDRYHEEKKI